MRLNTEVCLGPGLIVLDGDPAPHLQRGTASNFWPICCGQTAGWIKMPLGMKVGLGPSHIVLHGDPDPLKRGTTPNFWPMSIVAERSPISATAEHLLILGSAYETFSCCRWSQPHWLVTYYLHDAVYLYLRTVNWTLAEGHSDHRDGRTIHNRIIGQQFAGEF